MQTKKLMIFYLSLMQLIIIFYFTCFGFIAVYSALYLAGLSGVQLEQANIFYYLQLVGILVFFIARNFLMWWAWCRKYYRVIIYTSAFDWVAFGIALHYFLSNMIK